MSLRSSSVLNFSIAVGRSLAAALSLTALIVQFCSSVAFWRASGVVDIPTSAVNFWLFFTEDSNIILLAVFFVGSWRLLSERPGAVSGRWATVRIAAVSYIVLTGVGDSVLLGGPSSGRSGVVPWADITLHVLLPLLALVDWFVAPDRTALQAGRIGVVLIFPLAWITLTMLRGPFTPDPASGSPHHYPYPFLDPDRSGYLPVAVAIVALLAFTCVVELLLISSTRLPGRQRTARRA